MSGGELAGGAPDAALAGPDERRNSRSRPRAWLDDRINPILVKEVRQALRGSYFRNLFWIIVVGATAISVLHLLNYGVQGTSANMGPTFFLSNFAVMTAAINAFVPFWAFQSMGGEWEENTYDLLVISNLRPWQLLLGKALAAAIQSLLCFSAFAPYLVSTFLMGGVDILGMLLALGGSLILSFVLSLFAVSVATFGRSRVARGILAIVVIGILLWFSIASFTIGSMLVRNPQGLVGPVYAVALGLFLGGALLACGLTLAIGCARLGHEHENRSTPLRVMVVLITLGLLAWMLYGDDAGSRPRLEWFADIPTVAFVLTCLPFLFLFTENEQLGRRVQKQVPASRLQALLALPFLPGGGRAVWLYVITCGIGLGMVSLGMSDRGPVGLFDSNNLSRDPSLVVAGLYAYGFVFIGLPSGIGSFGIRSLRGRNGVRLAIPIALLIAIFGPVLIGLVFEIDDWRRFDHPLNPITVLYDYSYRNSARAGVGWWLLGLITLATLCVNLPRMWTAVLDTLRASDARRFAERVKLEAGHADRAN